MPRETGFVRRRLDAKPKTTRRPGRPQVRARLAGSCHSGAEASSIEHGFEMGAAGDGVEGALVDLAAEGRRDPGAAVPRRRPAGSAVRRPPVPGPLRQGARRRPARRHPPVGAGPRPGLPFPASVAPASWTHVHHLHQGEGRDHHPDRLVCLASRAHLRWVHRTAGRSASIPRRRGRHHPPRHHLPVPAQRHPPQPPAPLPRPALCRRHGSGPPRPALPTPPRVRCRTRRCPVPPAVNAGRRSGLSRSDPSDRGRRQRKDSAESSRARWRWAHRMTGVRVCATEGLLDALDFTHPSRQPEALTFPSTHGNNLADQDI